MFFDWILFIRLREKANKYSKNKTESSFLSLTSMEFEQRMKEERSLGAAIKKSFRSKRVHVAPSEAIIYAKRVQLNQNLRTELDSWFSSKLAIIGGEWNNSCASGGVLSFSVPLPFTLRAYLSIQRVCCVDRYRSDNCSCKMFTVNLWRWVIRRR